MGIEICRSLEEDVRAIVGTYDPGHDWLHIQRVRSLGRMIASAEGAKMDIVDAGCLIHDLYDHKFFPDEGLAEQELSMLLENRISCGYEILVEIWRDVSYGKGRIPSSLEGKCVQDADRLDALGAVGIARAFSYGGHIGRKLYSIDAPADPDTTVGHFYEKLFLLKEKMNTQTARVMAEERHEFMERFLDRFFAEWRGLAGSPDA